MMVDKTVLKQGRRRPKQNVNRRQTWNLLWVAAVLAVLQMASSMMVV